MIENKDDVTVRALLEAAVEAMEREGIPSARRNAEWLLCEAMGERRIGLLTRLDELAPPAATVCFEALLARRLAHEPLQYVLGYTEFFGLRIAVSPDVLIPRPETEQVVEEGLRVLEDVDEPRVLDIGTGSGCIALAMKSRRPDARVWACDVSEGALEVARSNAAATGLEVRLFRADALALDFAAGVHGLTGGLDLLISNPPYVAALEIADLAEEVRSFEPHLALVAPGDPLVFYRRLGASGLELIRQGGHIVLETHADFGSDAARLLEDLGYVGVDLFNDYAGRPRILRGERPREAS